MEPSPYSSTRRDDSDFNLKEWTAKARISRENTNSRRFSASYIRSFREDTRSFRSPNITFSSTASSPGYPLKDEIDPSTYSFTTALKALQAKSGYHTRDCSSPEGYALNSKWNEAEKYICNPLSGKVPLECLSAKTLSGSFRNSTNRITMSAPLVYSSRHFQTKPSTYTAEDLTLHFPIPEKKKEGTTRDVGTQSTPPYLSSSSPSPASTPPIVERAIKRAAESPISNAQTKSEEQVEEENDKERGETKETEKEREKKKKNEWREKEEQLSRQGAGCFSWIRKKEKGRLRKNNIYFSF